MQQNADVHGASTCTGSHFTIVVLNNLSDRGREEEEEESDAEVHRRASIHERTLSDRGNNNQCKYFPTFPKIFISKYLIFLFNLRYRLPTSISCNIHIAWRIIHGRWMVFKSRIFHLKIPMFVFYTTIPPKYGGRTCTRTYKMQRAYIIYILSSLVSAYYYKPGKKKVLRQTSRL